MAIQSNFPAIKPSLLLDFSNTKQLDPRITFTRASTGGFYNGVTTAMAEQNLVLYSQQFDNAYWVKTSVTVTADSIAAPDGTTTADTITGTAGGYTQYITITNPSTSGISSAVTNTYSVYLKAGTVSSVRIYGYNTTGGANIFGTFDLTAVTGVAGGSAMTPTVSIVDVGNSWRRVTVTGNVGGSVGQTAAIAIYADNGNFYAWGAQVEQRSAVSAYTATTTQAITNYIPVLQTAASGIARFDHNPTTGESLGLLIEESRTNLLLFSYEFENSSWSSLAVGATVTPNTVIAPDGTLTADKLIINSGATTNYLRQGITVAAVTYTMSVFAKAGEFNTVGIQLTNLWSPTVNGIFNLATGVATTSDNCTTSITSVGNGWYRCSVISSVIPTAGATGRTFILAGNNGNLGVSGNGFSGIYIWGAQIEAGSFSTSYIPTLNSQVTRAADAASMTGTNFSTWYNSGEGTMYAEAIAPSTTTNTSVGIVELSNSASAASNYIAIYRQSATWRFRTNLANLNLNPFPTDGSFNKMAFGYSATSYPISVNNTAVQTNTTTGLISGVNQLLIGFASITASPLSGTIKKLAYYPIRLSNTNLQALTS